MPGKAVESDVHWFQRIPVTECMFLQKVPVPLPPWQCNHMWLCDLCFVFSLSSEQTQLVCLFYHFVLLRNKGDVSWSWLWLLCGVSHKAWSECWKRCHCSCQLCKMTSDLWISFCHFKLRMCYTSHMLYGSSLGHILTSCIYASKKIWRVDKRFCYYFLVSLQ